MALPFYTIGHSNHQFEYFYEMLSKNAVQEVVDVRKMSASRSSPQFNEAELNTCLSEHGLKYWHSTPLGGLRKKSSINPAVNAFWDNQSFHNYADYALTEEFRSGINQLIEKGTQKISAIMCSEAVW